MADKMTDEQFVQAIALIAEKYGATIQTADLSQRWIEINCPEVSKVACSVEMGEFLQTVE